MSLYRRRNTRFLYIVLAIVLVFGVWQLSSLFWLSIFNGYTAIEDFLPGRIAEIITDWPGPIVTNNGTGSGPIVTNNGTGSGPAGTGDTGTGSGAGGTEPGAGPEGTGDNGTQPEAGGSGGGGGSPPPIVVKVVTSNGNLIYINTSIDYGLVFPGETLTDYFTVNLVEGVEGIVTYTVNMTLVGGFENMRPHIIIVRDPAEDPEVEPDSTANGTASDYMATGKLTDETDEVDKWLVTFYVPSDNGAYQTNIEIIPVAQTEITKD